MLDHGATARRYLKLDEKWGLGTITQEEIAESHDLLNALTAAGVDPYDCSEGEGME